MSLREMVMQAKEELKEYGIDEPTIWNIRDMVNCLYPFEVTIEDIQKVLIHE